MKNIVKIAGALLSALLILPCFVNMWTFEAGYSNNGQISSTSESYKLFEDMSGAKSYFSTFGKTLNQSFYSAINWICIISIAFAAAYIILVLLSFIVKERFIYNAIATVGVLLLLTAITAFIIIVTANSVNSYTGSLFTGAFYKVKASVGAWLFCVVAALAGIVAIASSVNPASCPFRRAKRKKAKK